MEPQSYWAKLNRKRLSRRQALKAGGVGAAAVVLAACGGDGDEDGADGGGGSPNAFLTPQPDTAAPVMGGTLQGGSETAFGDLDVQACLDCAHVAAPLNGYLYTYSRKRGLEPMLAEKFEQPDNNTFLWTMRKGVKFQNLPPVNGREVVVDDVTFSFERRKTEPTIQTPNQTLRERTDTFGAAGPDTFRLVTKSPYVPAVAEFGSILFPVIPHEVIEQGDIKSKPVGAGPWQLESFTRAEKMVMVKNPDFFIPGKPYLDRWEVDVIPDAVTMSQVFKTGQHDYYSGNSHGPEQRDAWKNMDRTLIRRIPNGWHAVLLMRVDKEPFNDIRLREVFDLAVDRQDQIDKAFGEAEISGPVVPYLTQFALPPDELWAFYGHPDPADLKAKLSAAGYPDGIEMDLQVLNVAGLDGGAEILKEQLAKSGITINLVLEELGTHLVKTIYGGNFKLAYTLVWPFGEPDGYLSMWHSKGTSGVSWTGYNDPEADEWVRKQREEFDEEKRAQIVQDAQRWMLQQHGPQICTTVTNYYTAWRDWLHGEDELVAAAGVWGYWRLESWLSERA